MQNKNFLIYILLFFIFYSNNLIAEDKNNIDYINGYKIINNESIIKKYNNIFAKIIPFNFEIDNGNLKYYTITFNKELNKSEKAFKKIDFIKYVEKYYNNENDFNIWLIVYFKDINSYRYYNAYTNNDKIMVDEYINNVNDENYLDYIFDEYKYNVNSYSVDLNILKKPLKKLDLKEETAKIDTILNNDLIKNITQKTIFVNNKFFVALCEKSHDSIYFLFWKNSKTLTKDPQVIIQDCKVFYSGSANNTDYICVNKDYVYDIAINYVSYPNVPKYELSIYKNDKINITEIDNDNLYDVLENLENILSPQELTIMYGYI